MSNSDKFVLFTLMVYVVIQAVVIGSIQLWLNRREKAQLKKVKGIRHEEI